MTNKAAIEYTEKAIQDFVVDLKNCVDMEDRRNSVIFLSDKLGAEAANQIAAIFGLKDGYYKI